MKITNNLFCLPPYISTTWDNVAALYMKDSTLVVSLSEEVFIQIPNLTEELITHIFNMHASFLQTEETLDKAAEEIAKIQPQHSGSLLQFFHNEIIPSSFRIGMASIDGMPVPLQHDPNYAHSEDIPQEILTKIAAVVKAIAPPTDTEDFPQSEAHCNCIYCQITRTIHEAVDGEPISSETSSEEVVTDKELEFQQWQISPQNEKVYHVSNKLDLAEQYTVSLEEPISCTCGNPSCEHIVAVLKS